MSAAVAPRKRGIPAIAIVIVIALLIGLLLRSCFGPHENTYEQIADGMTAALQRNDLPAVQKFQNAETATHVTRERVGRAADELGPLGKIKHVKETAVDTDRRIHDFDLTFEHGAIHERMKFDPDNKVVTFRYDRTPGN